MAKSFQGVIEILTLTLKPGARDQFHHLYITESLPLLRQWKINVLAHGPSLGDENSYYVIRHFKSLEAREKEEAAFYGSDDWRKGPRQAILALIEHEAYTVVSTGTIQEWVDGFEKAV